MGSDLWSRSLSSQPPPAPVGEQTSLSSWWALVGNNPLCGNLSALPCTPLLLCSPPWLQSFPSIHPPSLPVKGLPSVWKLFLLHSSLPEVQVPSLFFCLCFFFCPTQVRGEFLAFWEVWGPMPAFSRCSVGVVPHVDVWLMYLWGGKWFPHLTTLPSLRFLLKKMFLNYAFQLGQENISCHIFGECHTGISRPLLASLLITGTQWEQQDTANWNPDDQLLPISNLLLLSGAGLIFLNEEDK